MPGVRRRQRGSRMNARDAARAVVAVQLAEDLINTPKLFDESKLTPRTLSYNMPFKVVFMLFNLLHAWFFIFHLSYFRLVGKDECFEIGKGWVALFGIFYGTILKDIAYECLQLIGLTFFAKTIVLNGMEKLFQTESADDADNAEPDPIVLEQIKAEIVRVVLNISPDFFSVETCLTRNDIHTFLVKHNKGMADLCRKVNLNLGHLKELDEKRYRLQHLVGLGKSSVRVKLYDLKASFIFKAAVKFHLKQWYSLCYFNPLNFISLMAFLFKGWFFDFYQPLSIASAVVYGLLLGGLMIAPAKMLTCIFVFAKLAFDSLKTLYAYYRFQHFLNEMPQKIKAFLAVLDGFRGDKDASIKVLLSGFEGRLRLKLEPLLKMGITVTDVETYLSAILVSVQNELSKSKPKPPSTTLVSPTQQQSSKQSGPLLIENGSVLDPTSPPYKPKHPPQTQPVVSGSEPAPAPAAAGAVLPAQQPPQPVPEVVLPCHYECKFFIDKIMHLLSTNKKWDNISAYQNLMGLLGYWHGYFNHAISCPDPTSGFWEPYSKGHFDGWHAALQQVQFSR